MEKKIDRRIRKTEAQLRSGLISLMKKKSIKDITVKELVEEVDINRSTFYLHYGDIYQMLAAFEKSLEDEIKQILAAYPLNAPRDAESTYPFLTGMYEILDRERDFCNALMGPTGDPAFVQSLETLVAETVIAQLSKLVASTSAQVQYHYTFAMAGVLGMIRKWLSYDRSSQPSAAEMAKLTYSLVAANIKLAEEL